MAHGGTIGFELSGDLGTCFRTSLPRYITFGTEAVKD